MNYMDYSGDAHAMFTALQVIRMRHTARWYNNRKQFSYPTQIVLRNNVRGYGIYYNSKNCVVKVEGLTGIDFRWRVVLADNENVAFKGGLGSSVDVLLAYPDYNPLGNRQVKVIFWMKRHGLDEEVRIETPPFSPECNDIYGIKSSGFFDTPFELVNNACYKIKAKHSNLYLQATNTFFGSNIVQTQASNSGEQIFKIKTDGSIQNGRIDGYVYKIVESSNENQVLEIQSGQAYVKLGIWDNTDKQVVTIRSEGVNLYTFTPYSNRTKNYDIESESTSVGAKVFTSDIHNRDNQRFYLETAQCASGRIIGMSNPSGLENVSLSGGTGIFTVNSNNVNWTITGVPLWASLNTSSGGNGNTGVNITFQANSGSSRSGILVLSGDDDFSQNITISQQGTSGQTVCQCGFTLITANQNAGQYSGSYTFNSCNASIHKWKLLDGTTEIANSGSSAYTVTSATVNFNVPTSVNSGNYQLTVDADNCIGTGTQPFSYTKPGGGCTSPTPTLSASSSTVPSTLTASGCSGTVNWSTGASGNSISVSTAGTYTATCTNPPCTVSGNSSVTITSSGGGGGSCNYTDGQYLTTWFGNEVVNAYICGTKFYAKNNSGDFKSKSWLVGTGRFTTAETNCFEENDPRPNGCSGGGCTSPTPTLSASSSTVPSTLSASGCSGTVNWSTGASGNSIFVTSAGTYTATCTNPTCSVSGSGSVTVSGSGGGSCNYTNGQFLTEWFGNEVVRAYICGTKYYAKNDAGYFKSKSWLTGTGRFTAAELACFEEVNPGCGGLRIASSLIETDNGLEVFPNPTNDKIKVSFTLQKDENVWFNLYDIQGKSLDLRDFEGKTGRNEMEYDLQNYPSGAYFINFQSTEKREVLKVMKVN